MSIDIQTNSASTCHTLSYPSKMQGFPLFQQLRWQCMLQDLLQSQYRFHKPLTSWSLAKKKSRPVRSGERASQAVGPPHNKPSDSSNDKSLLDWKECYPFPSIPSCKIPLALKRSIAAHKFLNKICFNEGYLSDPKVCRSNLETLCIVSYLNSSMSQISFLNFENCALRNFWNLFFPI